jgi:hypothetical protein
MPYGRGLFENSDKIILGYVEDGEWVLGTQRIVILVKEKKFRVHWLIKTRNGRQLEFGQNFDPEWTWSGLLKDKYVV